MKCHKCGKIIKGDNFKKVANWTFCNECFEALLNKSEANSSNGIISGKTKESKDGIENKLDSKSDPYQFCHVCKKKILPSEAKTLLSLTFCKDCYNALITSPSSNKQHNFVSTSKDDRRICYRTPQIKTNLNQTVNCFSCGRIIPKVGAKDIDGNFYCPDCYQELNKMLRNCIVSNVKEEPYKRGSLILCQSCGRMVNEKFIEAVDGFDICKACLISDREVAIEIAKKRHKLFLKNIKEKFQLDE